MRPVATFESSAASLTRCASPPESVDAGNTVRVIEHNLDVIKQSDWVVDLGPEGGDAGGRVIGAGTPEQLAEVEESSTGQFLRGVLAAPKEPVQEALAV